MALRSTLPYQGPRLNIKSQQCSIVARSALEKVALTVVGAVAVAVVKSVADNHTQQDKKFEEMRKDSEIKYDHLRKDHAALDKNVALQLQLLSTKMDNMESKMDNMESKMDNMESKMASIVEGNMATREQLSSMQAQLTHLIGVLPKPLPHA